MTPVDQVIWWFGIAFLAILAVVVAICLWGLVLAACQSIDFTRRCLPFMRFKAEASRWAVARGLIGFTWANMWDAPDQVTFYGTGTVYWSPKDRSKSHPDDSIDSDA